MKRRRTSAQRGVALLVVIFALAVILGVVDYRVHLTQTHQTLMPPPNRFHVSSILTRWHGQPVYRITNRWHTKLERVTVESWSEQLVPILYVGGSVPAKLPTSQVHIHPPVDLSPGESMWIAGSQEKPYRLTIMWLDGTHERYQVYEVP
jgi:hypothetical protein